MKFEKAAKQAKKILAQMTLEEKIDIISGKDGMCTAGVPRLGVRRLHMADATMGLRDGEIPATAFPAFIELAATWDRDLAREYGAAVGSEFRAGGFDVLLGPGVNLYRVAQCGRNFEYLGEDPQLSAAMVVPYIEGAQAQGVSTTVKHFAANNMDWHRNVSDSRIDERTLRECYLFAFEAAIKKAGSLSLMTSYNLLNGEYTAESRYLIHDILLKDWGFEGLAMSDWGGTWHTKESFDSGLHLEMGGAKVWKPETLKELAKKGKLDLAELDRKALAVLRLTFALEEAQKSAPKAKGPCKEHTQTALETARRGTVLLKNGKNALPLKKSGSICVVGPAAFPTPTSGGGAATVKAIDPKSILGSLMELAPELHVKTGERFVKESDAVVVCVGFNASLEAEGFDRQFDLPWEQVHLIKKCVERNPNVIVVIIGGGGVCMDTWIDKVSAVVHGWYPGVVGSQAIAEILLGLVNPSGRLPISIERNWEDAPAFENYIPTGAALYGNPDYNDLSRPVFPVNYAEKVFIGYRHYDKTGKAPLFPFGFGLSYTKFEYSALKVSLKGKGATVSFKVKNTGKREGIETPQVYVGDVEASVPRPLRELKGFAKVSLKPGESKSVSIDLDERAFAFYDVKKKDWKVEAGKFVVEVGASARDIKLKSSIIVK